MKGSPGRREVFLLLIVVLAISFALAVEPFGASVNEENSTRANADAPGTHAAIAGNVTEITIQGYSITQSWQGYYGNVSGALTLENAAGNVLYNWSLASPQGEVYASKNSSLDWTYLQCFNFTAAGNYTSDLLFAGGTSQFGTNMTQLETEFNIAYDDVDGVNETFTLIGGGTHDAFYTNSIQFNEGQCQNTRLFGDTGQGESNEFEEVLLYEPSTFSVVFMAILDEDVLGFDNSPHDFEMLVLEDGHGTDTSTTIYNFYVELE